jgi:hypothetical protein
MRASNDFLGLMKETPRPVKWLVAIMACLTLFSLANGLNLGSIASKLIERGDVSPMQIIQSSMAEQQQSIISMRVELAELKAQNGICRADNSRLLEEVQNLRKQVNYLTRVVKSRP